MAQQIKPAGIMLRPRTLGTIIVGTATVVGTIVAIIALLRQPAPPPSIYTYSARIPGPTCDHGAARWVEAPHGDSTCLSDRMQLSTDASQGIGQVFFYGTQHLPTDNKVSVDIDGLKDGVCAGIITRNADTRKGGYAFEACADGTWVIAKYDQTDTPFPLAKGAGSPQSAYSMTAITQGISLRLSLDGKEVGLAPEGTFTDTDSISLFVTPLPSGTSTANFHNFSFAELT